MNLKLSNVGCSGSQCRPPGSRPFLDRLEGHGGHPDDGNEHDDQRK